MGAFPLLGMDRKSWSKEAETDLVALMARQKPDAFSGWFAETLIPFFHRVLGAKFKVYFERVDSLKIMALISRSDHYRKT